MGCQRHGEEQRTPGEIERIHGLAGRGTRPQSSTQNRHTTAAPAAVVSDIQGSLPLMEHHEAVEKLSSQTHRPAGHKLQKTMKKPGGGAKGTAGFWHRCGSGIQGSLPLMEHHEAVEYGCHHHRSDAGRGYGHTKQRGKNPMNYLGSSWSGSVRAAYIMQRIAILIQLCTQSAHRKMSVVIAGQLLHRHQQLNCVCQCGSVRVGMSVWQPPDTARCALRT